MREKIIRLLPKDHPWAPLVQVHDCLDSTNTYAKELAKQGAPEGTVVIARSQRAGRGRLGRSFHSPKDTGLYMSLILRPNCAADALMHLTCAVAVAACDAVERTCGLRPGIKWINDLVLESKKLGGILTELSFETDGNVSSAVIGIGINCRTRKFPRELKHIACSLSHYTNQTSPAVLASELIIALEEMNRTLLTDHQAIMDRYRTDCVTIGRQVRVFSPDGVNTGIAKDVHADGSLQVLFDDGQRRNVNVGEVSVRGLWDYV